MAFLEIRLDKALQDKDLAFPIKVSTFKEQGKGLDFRTKVSIFQEEGRDSVSQIKASTFQEQGKGFQMANKIDFISLQDKDLDFQVNTLRKSKKYIKLRKQLKVLKRREVSKKGKDKGKAKMWAEAIFLSINQDLSKGKRILKRRSKDLIKNQQDRKVLLKDSILTCRIY